MIESLHYIASLLITVDDMIIPLWTSLYFYYIIASRTKTKTRTTAITVAIYYYHDLHTRTHTHHTTIQKHQYRAAMIASSYCHCHCYILLLYFIVQYPNVFYHIILIPVSAIRNQTSTTNRFNTPQYYFIDYCFWRYFVFHSNHTTRTRYTFNTFLHQISISRKLKL